MNFTGKFISSKFNPLTNQYDITFSINEKSALYEIDKIKDLEKLSIKAEKHKKKRSLDANAYMWVLLSKMAEVLQVEKEEIYLEMLSRYGVFTHIVVKEKMVEKVKKEWRLVRVLGKVTINKKDGIQLQCYFGSSTYDTKEMSVLIDGVVREAKDLEIETLPPEELEILKREWGVK